MKFYRLFGLALFGAAAIIFPGCAGTANDVQSNSTASTENQTKANLNAVKTNVEELSVLINVPYEAEDVVWKDDAQRKRLIAVFRFSSADSSRLVSELEKTRKPDSVKISPETWFPDDLLAQSEMNSDNNLNGLAYAAGIFLQPPYSDGRITRIEGTDYFVLEISGK